VANCRSELQVDPYLESACALRPSSETSETFEASLRISVAVLSILAFLNFDISKQSTGRQKSQQKQAEKNFNQQPDHFAMFSHA
jgi:hypothetical protein